MATYLKKTNAGRWEAQVNVDGVRRSKTFKLKPDAKRWAMDKERELEDGVRTSNESFGLAINLFRDHALPKLSPTTRKDYRNRLKVIERELGQHRLDKITPKRIHHWLASMTCQDPTRNRYRSILSAIFTFISKTPYEMVTHNPVAQVQKFRENKRRERVLTPGEIETLISTADAMAHEARDESDHESIKVLPLFLRFLNETGCRRGEALSLRVDRMRDDRICLLESKVKDKNTGLPELRPVVISEELHQAILEYDRGTSVFAFPGRFDRSPAAVDPAWRVCRDRAGIVDVGFHTFRHTAITRVGKNGGSMLQLMTFSGHKTPGMVARYYHQDDETLRQVAALNH